MDVKISVEEGNPEVNVNVDKEKMANLGLNIAQVGGTLQNAFSGNNRSDSGKAPTNMTSASCWMRLTDRTNTDDVRNISFVNNQGQLIEVEPVCYFPRQRPDQLERRDRISSVTVSSYVFGRPQGTVAKEIQATIAGAGLPPTVNVAFGGQLKNQNDAFGNLALALLASILFVYLIMVALYDSYVYPFVVLFSIPVAIVGALLGLALAMENLSIFSFLGIIMPVGLVAKNAILLVDFTNHLKS